VPQPSGQVNILFMGADQRQGSNFRTAVILLVTLRPDGSVNLTSFPRDLYVYMPGKQMERLSAAMQVGGFDLVQTTFDYNFGFRPDHYLLTDLSGFPRIIDLMGGVDVQVARTFHGTRPGYPQGFSISAGKVHMDGATAMWYSSAQSFSDDVNRLGRSQEVMIAMGKKLFSMDALTHVPEIYNLFRSSVDTDLSLGQVVKLLPQMLAIDPGKVGQYSLGPDQTTPWVEPFSRTQYLIPRPEAVKKVIQQAIGIP
jgi:LCP family protein required for cell wall assembly